MVISVPQLLNSRHVPEATIAAMTAVMISPGFWTFLVSPVLDVRFSRRWYCVVSACAAAIFLVLALLNLDHLAWAEGLLAAGYFFANLYQSALEAPRPLALSWEPRSGCPRMTWISSPRARRLGFERIGSDTIQRVTAEFATRRKQFKKVKLRWRSSRGSRRALGWIPFKAVQLVKWKSGCFSQDAVGDWWLSVPVEYPIEVKVAQNEEVGLDLGLKDTVATSDGEKLEAGRVYRHIEQNIAQAQRRGNKRQAERLHRRAARRRNDSLHKFSRKIVNRYQRIIIGDVSSIQLVKTRLATAVLDAGWGMLKAQLQYKGYQAGKCIMIVSEKNTTRACSNCRALTGPTGLDMLGVRAWVCSECGGIHDRDVNAARNIRFAPRCSPSVSGNEPSPSGAPPEPKHLACAWLRKSAPTATCSLTNFFSGIGDDFHASSHFVGAVGGGGVLLGGVAGCLLFRLIDRLLPLRFLYLTIGAVGAVFTLALILLPHTPATTASTAISFETIGRDNPLAATTYCLMVSAFNVPITYASLSLIASAVLAALLIWVMRRRSQVARTDVASIVEVCGAGWCASAGKFVAEA